MEKAVIDRFEGNLAVLLVGEEQKPMDVERTSLPTEAKDGDWLLVEIEGGVVVQATLDPQKTSQMKRNDCRKIGSASSWRPFEVTERIYPTDYWHRSWSNR